MSTFLFLRGKGRRGRRRDWVEGDKKKFAEFEFGDVMMMMKENPRGDLQTCIFSKLEMCVLLISFQEKESQVKKSNRLGLFRLC